MILHNAYLSDEELELLMTEAEADMVPASPAVEEAVYLFMQNEKNMELHMESNQIKCRTNKKRFNASENKIKSEYISYCMRVSFTVAASILMIFILSYWKDSGIDYETAEGADAVMSKELYLGMVREESLTEEVVREYQQMRECPSREEVLRETNFINKMIEESALHKTDERNQRKDNGGE